MANQMYKNKDGSINYERLSKDSGLTKADLEFLVRGDFNLIDRALLISGVFVGRRSVVKNNIFSPNWDLRTCYSKPEDLAYITKLITNHGNDFNSLYEYFVMDSVGNVLHSNCNISNTVDERGVIHLSVEDETLDQYVYPASLKKCKHKCFYFHDESISGLNKQIKTYEDKKLITKVPELNGGFVDASKQEERQQ